MPAAEILFAIVLSICTACALAYAFINFICNVSSGIGGMFTNYKVSTYFSFAMLWVILFFEAGFGTMWSDTLDKKDNPILAKQVKHPSKALSNYENCTNCKSNVCS